MSLLSTVSFTGRPLPKPGALLSGLHEKQQAVAGVIAGRLTLREAADRFRAAGCEAAGSSDELVCRSVIGWVHLALSERPERAEEVSSRLERELLEYLGHSDCLPVAG